MQKKHDIFDWLGDMMRIPVAIVSGTFTGKLLAKTLGFNGFDAIMIVIVVSAILTIMEVVYFRKWSKTGDYAALFIAILISITSISGSVGYYYTGFKENSLASDQYIAKKAEVDGWLADSDKSKNPKAYLWARQQARKAQAELQSISISGAGVGNAYYEIVGELFGWSTKKAALVITIFIASVIELILIYSAIKTDEPVRPSSTRQPVPASTRQPINLKKKRPSTSNPVNVDGKSGLTSTEAQILQLYDDPKFRHPDGTPKTTKIADYIGKSKQLVSRTIKEKRANNEHQSA